VWKGSLQSTSYPRIQRLDQVFAWVPLVSRRARAGMCWVWETWSNRGRRRVVVLDHDGRRTPLHHWWIEVPVNQRIMIFKLKLGKNVIVVKKEHSYTKNYNLKTNNSLFTIDMEHFSIQNYIYLWIYDSI